MGALFSVPVNVDMNAWIKLLEDLNVNLDLAALKDAMNNNNLELFNSCLSNILNNLNFQDMVRVKAKMSLAGNDLNMGGIGNGLPEAMVAMVAVMGLVVVMALSSMQGTAFLTMMAIGAPALAFAIRSKRGKSVPQTLVDPRPAQLSVSEAVHQNMLQKLADRAKMPRLTQEQLEVARDLVASRYNHVIVTQCKHIVTAFVGKSTAGDDLSYLVKSEHSSRTVADANKIVAKKLKQLEEAVYECDRANMEKKERYVKLAQFQAKVVRQCRAWIPKLKGLNKKFGVVLSHVKAALMLADDFAVAGAAVRERDHFFGSIAEKCDELNNEAQKLLIPSCVKFARETQMATRDMMTSIVYSSSLHKAEKEALSEAMKQADMLLRRQSELSSACAGLKQEKRNISANISARKALHDRKKADLEEDLGVANGMVKFEGRSFWQMKGSPNDELSRKYAQLWKQSKFNELREYSSGDFVLRKVSAVGKAQAEERRAQLRAQMAKLQEELETELDPLRTEEKRLEANIETLETEQAEAKKNYNEAAGRLSKGLTNLPPAHKAHVEELLRVSEVMENSSKTFLPCSPELEHITELLDELHGAVTDEEKPSVKSVLEIISRLNVQANDEEVSSTIFLKQLGASTITHYLVPPVDPGSDEMAEMQSIMDEPPRKKPAQEVD